MRVNVNIALLPRNSTNFDLNMWVRAVDGHMRHAYVGYTEKENEAYIKKFAPHIFTAYEDLKEIDRVWYKEHNSHIDYFEKIKTWMDNNSEKLKKYL